MRFGISGIHRRALARGAAVTIIGGLAAGCSSDVMRFQDSILTGSSRNAPQAAPVQQAYPGDVQLDQTYTGSVARGAVRTGGILQKAGLVPRPQADVQAGGMAVASTPNNPYPAAQPVYQQPSQPLYDPVVASAVSSAPLAPASGVDTTVTGSTAAAKPVPVAAQPMPRQAAKPVPAAVPAIVSADGDGGWTRAGGTQVAVKQGETVYNLSRRFGVPVDAILKANGLGEASALAAGQNVVIPTYVHSARAPVSAPDANPNVADAKSSTGSRYDLPANKVPVPGDAPGERLAILPTQPKLKEPQPGAMTAATDAQRNSGAPGSGSYTVVAGDTLSGISRKTGASVDALRQANSLSSGLIRIGQTLVVPAGGAAPQVQTAQARTVDQTTTATTPKASAYTPPRKADSIVEEVAVSVDAQAPDATGIGKMRWPVRGRVISEFGGTSAGKKNDGIDIAVPSGTPVKAAENGVVIYAGDGLKEFGNTVLVRHEDGLVTVYGHASEIMVQRGQQVRRGEELALAGMSGAADTPKLHFEVRKDSAPVNPVGFLE